MDGLDGALLCQFGLLRTACDELLNSKSLKTLLHHALVMGNYINGDAGSRHRKVGQVNMMCQYEYMKHTAFNVI